MKEIEIENTIISYHETMNEILKQNKEIKQKMQRIENSILFCTQKIGVFRYNAFEDVGSELSFVIAVLDANDNGFVINGVYVRENSTTYAKPIISGKSKHPLSAEEIIAIDIAKKNHDQKVFLTK